MNLNQEPANRTLHLIEETSDGPNVPPIDLHPEDAPHRPQLLSRCLAAWRDNEDDMGSLSCLIPPCGFLTLQVLDISMSEGEPTGRIEIHDGQCHVSANVDPRYIVELKKRSWGKYSLIQIKATTGLHTDLVLVCVIVYYCLFLLFILFQTKFSHPKSIQLVPKRSLVSLVRLPRPTPRRWVGGPMSRKGGNETVLGSAHFRCLSMGECDTYLEFDMSPARSQPGCSQVAARLSPG